MKIVIAILLIGSTLTFAGSKKELDMLNAEMMAIQEKNKDIIDENVKLEATNKSLTAINKSLQDSCKELNNSIVNLKGELNKKDAIITEYKKNAEVKVQKAADNTPSIPVFPLTAKILQKKSHDPANIAVLLSFYNGSANDLNGFTANLQFVQNGKVLLKCVVAIQKNFPSGQNVTWYGAIPYDDSNADNLQMFNSNIANLSVIVDAQSVTYINGTTRNYK